MYNLITHKQCTGLLHIHFYSYFSLSLSATSVSTSYNYYSLTYRETAPTHLSNVTCQGSEVILTNCNHTLGGSGTAVSMRCDFYTSGMSFIKCNIRLKCSYHRVNRLRVMSWILNRCYTTRPRICLHHQSIFFQQAQKITIAKCTCQVG